MFEYKPVHIQQTGYNIDLISKLKNLLITLEINQPIISKTLEQCLAQSDPPLKHPPSDQLNAIIDHFQTEFYLGSNRLKLPLINFIIRLERSLADASQVNECLREITDDLTQRQQITREDIEQSEKIENPVVQEQTPYLMVTIDLEASDENACRVDCYYQDVHGHSRMLDSQEEQSLNDVPKILNEQYNKLGKKIDSKTRSKLHLELFLPKKLLTDHVRLQSWECWNLQISDDPEDPPFNICTEHPVNLRCWDRYNENRNDVHRNCGYDKLEDNWNGNKAYLNHPATDQGLVSLEQETVEFEDHIQQNGTLGFRLCFQPATRYFRELLNAGTAIILSPRAETLNADTEDLLDKSLPDHQLHELPGKIQQLRRKIWRSTANQQTGYHSLLWDDPDRFPGRVDDQMPEDIPLEFEN